MPDKKILRRINTDLKYLQKHKNKKELNKYYDSLETVYFRNGQSVYDAKEKNKSSKKKLKEIS